MGDGFDYRLMREVARWKKFIVCVFKSLDTLIKVSSQLSVVVVCYIEYSLYAITYSPNDVHSIVSKNHCCSVC